MLVVGGLVAIYPFDGALCANMADRVVRGLTRQGHLRKR